MKSNSIGNAIFCMIAMAITGIVATGCQKEIKGETKSPDALLASDNAISSNASKGGGFFQNENIIHVPLFIEDANMQLPQGNATLLWNKSGHVPILAPDNHQLTLGEFNSVSGSTDVKCINSGTHVVLHLKGLIPKGVYTIWVVTFKSPGFDVTFANQIGEGALGATDGSQNSFTASAAGTASISVIMPAGSLSEFGTVGSCLSSEYEFQLAGAYHLDNLTHGKTPGDPNTWTIQFAFDFHQNDF